MQKIPQRLAQGKVKVIKAERVWDRFLRLWEITVQIPRFDNGFMEQVREVHDHGNAAVVLPVDPKARKVLLVRQWRIPPLLNGYDEPLLEAVAGLIDPGETPLACAKREALEETGYHVTDLTQITECYASPGTLTEYFYLYAGQYESGNNAHDGGGIADEAEDIEVVEISFNEIKKMLAKGDIKDAKTYMALTWALARYGKAVSL